jgi:hypothetical protein
MGGAAHLGMQAKALRADTALLRGPRLLAGDGLQAQYFLARPGPERDAIGAGRRLQGCKRGIRIGVGQVGHALLFNEITFTRQ